jgi:hypothetical protein
VDVGSVEDEAPRAARHGDRPGVRPQEPRASSERDDAADSVADGAHGHNADQALGGGALGVLSETTDVRRVPHRGHGDPVLTRARHGPLDREHRRVLTEPAMSVDQSADAAVAYEDGSRRGHDDALVHVAHVLRNADHAVGVVARQVRADQVARELRRHIGVRAHAAGDGGHELAHWIGRTEHGGRVIGHGRSLRFENMMAASIIARRLPMCAGPDRNVWSAWPSRTLGAVHRRRRRGVTGTHARQEGPVTDWSAGFEAGWLRVEPPPGPRRDAHGVLTTTPRPPGRRPPRPTLKAVGGRPGGRSARASSIITRRPR